ncbi:(2Fe-2S) ferredoxin domain-containing protein [Brevibacillus daliensis]|uniref:(2Fe-2S) ferredoxin domain-containing protein n=1 Tax=Brevibacillus daliensis TaxID=2892995 RepID=UPI001E2B0972|nr:(2Fe-2S) ferredoxin domain-containing protein [Brevibacillus daliensis]
MATWDLSRTNHHILICNGGSCMRKSAEEVTQAIRSEISRLEAHDLIHTTRTRCNGRCEDACVVIVYPEGIWYKDIGPNEAPLIVQHHLLEGKPVREFVSHEYALHGFERTKGTIRGTNKSEK